MKVIIVEDEIRIREGICKLFGKMFPEYQVVGMAVNGEEGLKMILDKRPELVVTDVKMPVMDGLQMVARMYENKVKSKVIVLSAYSEFSYAQQAIRFGVSEYLVKPLVFMDFVQAVKNVESQLEEVEKLSPEVLGNLEHVLFGLIFGGMGLNEELSSFLETKYEIGADCGFSEVCLYLGGRFEAKSGRIRRILEDCLSRKEMKYCILEMPKEKLLLVVFYGIREPDILERWFRHEIIELLFAMGNMDIGLGWINALGAGELRGSFQKLQQYMEWNISFGDKVMISYPKILQVQTAVCIYPIEIENSLKAAVCALDKGRIGKSLERFNAYFGTDYIYAPKEIKESYVRFLWVMMNVSKEIGLLDYEKLEQQKILEKIMSAVNKEELKKVSEEIFSFLRESIQEDDGNVGLNVKKAESMFLEYYQQGITLEEIAARLNLTPEYLGMLFHKEKGVKFSAYARDYRIAKAKAILISSQMKLGEVADRVGYSDAKYFSRVFKECTGQLPAEYRKTHK
ncbi:two-component system response regulator YesN [Kineothrix alysoides]|uniref:Stage 0 sporulation protein A homolog n=1 Tax=Kineothrix alysoides TaxID=1469948 RepID=A0A4R1QUH9_9FIRM|nr:response regulator [Kineothrix alysoides]TCL54584.1 two-component system response regulator YesN [Kineothrix alysoides]